MTRSTKATQLDNKVPLLPPLWGFWSALGDHKSLQVARQSWVTEHIPAVRRQCLLACQFAARVLPVWYTGHSHDGRPEAAIHTAKQYADGQATIDELAAAHDVVVVAANSSRPTVVYAAGYAAAHCAAPTAGYAAASAAFAASEAFIARNDRIAERNDQSCILRLWADRAEWHAEWRTVAVQQVAQSIYNREDWAVIPMLADALADAGCTDETALGWLRCQELQPHFFRGQWALDWCCGYLER